jgi:hypothetical protein
MGRHRRRRRGLWWRYGARRYRHGRIGRRIGAGVRSGQRCVCERQRRRCRRGSVASASTQFTGTQRNSAESLEPASTARRHGGAHQGRNGDRSERQCALLETRHAKTVTAWHGVRHCGPIAIDVLGLARTGDSRRRGVRSECCVGTSASNSGHSAVAVPRATEHRARVHTACHGNGTSGWCGTAVHTSTGTDVHTDSAAERRAASGSAAAPCISRDGPVGAGAFVSRSGQLGDAAREPRRRTRGASASRRARR